MRAQPIEAQKQTNIPIFIQQSRSLSPSLALQSLSTSYRVTMRAQPFEPYKPTDTPTFFKCHGRSRLHLPCRVFSPKRAVIVAFATWVRALWQALTYRGSLSRQPQSYPLQPLPSTLYSPSQPSSTTLIRVARSSTHGGKRRPHVQSSGGRVQLIRQALQHQWSRLNICPVRAKYWRWQWQWHAQLWCRCSGLSQGKSQLYQMRKTHTDLALLQEPHNSSFMVTYTVDEEVEYL